MDRTSNMNLPKRRVRAQVSAQQRDQIDQLCQVQQGHIPAVRAVQGQIKELKRSLLGCTLNNDIRKQLSKIHQLCRIGRTRSVRGAEAARRARPQGLCRKQWMNVLPWLKRASEALPSHDGRMGRRRSAGLTTTERTWT